MLDANSGFIALLLCKGSLESLYQLSSRLRKHYQANSPYRSVVISSSFNRPLLVESLSPLWVSSYSSKHNSRSALTIFYKVIKPKNPRSNPTEWLILPTTLMQVKFSGMTGVLFLLLKPILFLMVKKLFKKQMKAFLIQALEWLVAQTDNDIDDLLVGKVKTAMKLGVV